MKIRLMVAHEHELIRSGVVQLFQDDPDIVVVAEGACGEVSDLTGLFNTLRTTCVDLLLLGMSMPAVYVAEVISRIRNAHPDLPVLVLGMDNDILTVSQVMKAGASGFIAMNCTSDALLRAVHKVAAAGRYLDPKMAEKLASDTNSTVPSETVSAHRAHILSKLGLLTPKQWALSQASFQQAGNFDCYATAHSRACDQVNCCWRDDCFGAAPIRTEVLRLIG